MKTSGDLPSAALEELQALQAELKASKVDAVMADVRELGRWPKAVLHHYYMRACTEEVCVESLCMNHPKMPPLALANSFFGGRHHPLFREASMATRRLASSARLIMKQSFLGRGPQDECQKGMTGNTMLIAQPSPGYETVLPNPGALSEGVVVLFCKSIEDVNKTKEERANMLGKTRAPPCRFFFYHTSELQQKDKTTRIRRRGKEIVDVPYISSNTARNEFGSVALERPQPFRSPSSDCCLVAIRGNNDFRYMPKGFPPDVRSLHRLFRCDVEQLAACFRSHARAIKAYRSLQPMAMTIVALHVAAKIVDYYITKYAAKPMEQLQNLVTQYALGLRRLELEEAEENRIAREAQSSCISAKKSHKARARRIMLRLQYSANRSKWISSTEAALYVHTEQQHWTSHNEVAMFLSRPLYQISECKRILSGSPVILTRADVPVSCSVLSYECRDDAMSGDGSHLASERRPCPTRYEPATRADPAAPMGVHNIGNTCFMNSILQCFRQMLLRIPSDLLPKSQRCPLAVPLKQRAFSKRDVQQWDCWKYLAVGPQRDACHVLEMCLDERSDMHCNCDATECYATILRNITTFELTRTTVCDNSDCTYSHQDPQIQSILRVEPVGHAQDSIQASLEVARVHGLCACLREPFVSIISFFCFVLRQIKTIRKLN